MSEKFINEVAGKHDFTQDIPLPQLQVLINIGALVHEQTSVYPNHIHRYFAIPKDARTTYSVVDYSNGKKDDSQDYRILPICD